MTDNQINNMVADAIERDIAMSGKSQLERFLCAAMDDFVLNRMKHNMDMNEAMADSVDYLINIRQMMSPLYE